MKHIRIYEDFRDIKVDDIVVSIDTLPKNKRGHEIIRGNKYKVLFINNGFAEVEDIDGNFQGNFLLARFLSEHEWDQYKYNL